MPQAWTMHHHGKPPQSFSDCGMTGSADSTPRRETSRPYGANLAEEAQAQTMERASIKKEASGSSRRFIYGGRARKKLGDNHQTQSVLRIYQSVG